MRKLALIRKLSKEYASVIRASKDIRSSTETLTAALEIYDDNRNRTNDNKNATYLAMRLLLQVADIVAIFGNKLENIYEKTFFDFPDEDFTEFLSEVL